MVCASSVQTVFRENSNRCGGGAHTQKAGALGLCGCVRAWGEMGLGPSPLEREVCRPNDNLTTGRCKTYGVYLPEVA